MFTKKNMIVIALIAIFVIGAAVLQALEYDICVHVIGNPGSAYYQIPIGGGNQYISLSNGANYDTVDGPYPTNFYIHATSAAFPYYTDSDSSGSLDPNHVNHFYLIIDGSAEEDKTIPGNQ